MKFRIATFSIALLLAPTAGQASGDVAKGKTVFARCAACHAIAAGQKRLGPSLAGIVGRKAGKEANFNYSPAMKSSLIVWNAKTLDAYITDPRAFMPGNRMVFGGLTNAASRADLIAYLSTLK